MKTFKRIASIILAIAMIAAMVVVPVSAAEDVFKLWEFDTMPASAELRFTAGVTNNGITDSVVSTTAKRDQTMNIGTKGTAELGWLPAEHPYLEIKWSFEAAAVDTTRASIAINAHGANGDRIGQITITEDIDGEIVSNEMKIHKYDLTKAKLTNKTATGIYNGVVTTLEQWLNSEISYMTVYMWNRSASGVAATVKIDYVKICNPGLDASVELTAPAAGAVVYDVDTVPLTAKVEGAEPVKVEFFVNDVLAGTDTDAPYSVEYKFTEERENKIHTIATLADGTTVKSSVSTVTSIKNGRLDFNTIIPNSFYAKDKATLDGEGAVVISGTSGTYINIGMPSYPIIKGGFDPTKHKYIKMRAKVTGTAKADKWVVSYTPKGVGNESIVGGTLTHVTDENGNVFSTEYQQFVFDITKGFKPDTTETIDFTGLTAGWIAMYPMRQFNPGTISIDWIEISDNPNIEIENPTIVNLTTDKTSAYSGETVTLTASVEGTAPEKIEFYVNDELIATDDTSPYQTTYVVTGEKKYSFKAKGISGNKASESGTVAVTSFNEMRFDFDEIIPPTFGRTNAVLDGKGAVKYYNAAAGAGVTINLGLPWLNLKKGGFDPTEYKYLKMRARLVGTAKSDQYTLSGVICDMNPTEQVNLAEFVFVTDDNGQKLNSEYQDLVFDLTKGTSVDLTGKTAGWIQIRPMRQVSPGTIVFDSIELTNEIPVSVSLTADKSATLSGGEVTLTSSVKGAEAEKIEFYADGTLIATDEEAPFEATYTVTGEKLHKFTAKAYAGENVIDSGISEVISYNELRLDFNVLPPNFLASGAVLNGDGTVSINGPWSTGINIGMPKYPIKAGGFDPTEYRFIKMRAKLTGTANSDSYTISYTLRPNGQTSGGITLTHPKDENGRIINDEWQELVFDISKAGIASGAPTEDGIYGWMQMLPMRKVNPGTITIDYIELSKDPIVTLTANKSGVYREGVEVTLDAGVAGVDATSIKFYDGDKLIGEDSSAPYSITYTAMGEEKHEFTARVETANGTIKSLPSYVSTYTEMRFDFNTVIPPNFETGSATKTLDGEGAVKIEGANSTMINVGRPENPLKVGGFDPTDYKYMKIRAKLLGTPKSDSYTLSFAMYDIDSTQSYGTFTYKTDMYGKTFTEEYQELVFDLTDGRNPDTGEVIDISGKRAGWLQIMPMRKANPAVMYIDYIEFASSKPYKIATPEFTGDEILTSTILNDNMDDVVDTENIVYIAAKYNGNDLTDVKFQPVTLTEMEEATTPIDVSAMEIADGERIDVMAVKSFSDMTPIMEKVTVYDNGISAKDATFAGAFMDHMVLQRDMPVNVWGKADAADGGVLEISFAGNTVSAVVEDGKWQAKLPALKESAVPQVLSVKSLSGTKEITDVLVGDVYFVAGQSNAAFTLNGTDTWEADREGAVAEDNIRILFSAKNAYSEEKRDTPYENAVWQPAVNKTEAEAGWDKYGHTMINFPAIGYYMADTLRADGVDVPLGLVSIAKSGATLAAISPAHLSEGISDANKAQAYNGYVAPVENMTVKAMLWYQGESDANDRCAPTYAERFSNFVDYMRGKTGNDDMAVFMVQLSSHSDQPDGTASSWQLGKMRSIQADMVLNKTIDNLYMVASLDKGWKNGDKDIAHPMYKKPVGQRLAKVIENVFYNGENVTMPMPVAVTFDEGVCSIEFDKNLTDSTEVLGFELIKDGVAYAATIAEANGNIVDIAVENEVLCDAVADGVRYAFYSAASPLVANLQGENGLYAPTFAIDNPDADTAVKAAYVDPISRGQVE